MEEYFSSSRASAGDQDRETRCKRKRRSMTVRSLLIHRVYLDGLGGTTELRL